MPARAQSASDPLLRQTRQTARAIMRDIKQLPKADRMVRLESALSSYDPGLPEKVKAVASTLHRRGVTLNKAVESALTLALADASIDRARRAEKRTTAGVGALGSTEAMSGVEDDLKTLATSIACSQELQRTAAEKAGEADGGQAYNATIIGFKAAQSAVKCPERSGQDLTKPPPGPVDKPEDDDWPLAVPIVVGATVLGLAVVAVWYTRT